jgi:hypothetical protein
MPGITVLKSPEFCRRGRKRLELKAFVWPGMSAIEILTTTMGCLSLYFTPIVPSGGVIPGITNFDSRKIRYCKSIYTKRRRQNVWENA